MSGDASANAPAKRGRKPAGEPFPRAGFVAVCDLSNFMLAITDWRKVVSADRLIDGTTKFVALSIAGYINADDGYAFPSQETLRDTLGISLRSVSRCIQLLERRGWITRQRLNRATSNRYLLSWSIPLKDDLLTDLERTREARANRREMKRLEAVHRVSDTQSIAPRTRNTLRVGHAINCAQTDHIEQTKEQILVTDKESLEEEDTGAREIPVVDPQPASDRFRLISDMLTNRVSGPPLIEADPSPPPARASPLRESG